MSSEDDLIGEVSEIFRTRWTTREGQKVPDDGDIALRNDGVYLDATVLYADLAESTSLVTAQSNTFAAEVYKAYLNCAAKIIRRNGGVITAYDGDLIMAVFIGGHKNTNAAKAALQVNYAVLKIINPELQRVYSSNTYVLRQAVGVDTGRLLVAKTGIRGANDLVWVGSAANYSAKLCELREGNYTSWITGRVYSKMNDSSKFSSDGRDMWEARSWTKYGGMSIYRSNWRWSV